MKQIEEGRVEICATIFVERDSQKQIVIGKNGAMLKKVRELARRDINRLLGSKADLTLWVKVKKIGQIVLIILKLLVTKRIVFKIKLF